MRKRYKISELWSRLRKSYMQHMRGTTRGPRMGREGNNPIHINVSVKPINPCATYTPKKTPPFRQPNFGRRKTGSSTSTQGTTTGGASLGNTSQVYMPRGGSSSVFTMARNDPTIRLT
jgi:hypothetical protein